MPTLSLCIPTYNRADCLDGLLQSIVQNHHPNISEVIISDNNSSDTTQTVAQKHKQWLPIHYYKNSRNIGASNNLLKAADLGSGDYLWFLADDDLLIKDAVNSLLDAIGSHPAQYYFSPRHLVDRHLNPHPIGVQPRGLKETLLFQTGKDLFDAYNGQMPSILGFFSSTIIGRSLWQSCPMSPSEMDGEFFYLKKLLQVIVDQPSAILSSAGIYCRLENSRGFSANSRVWFDDYIRTMMFAKSIGYSQKRCDEQIRSIIHNFSKS